MCLIIQSPTCPQNEVSQPNPHLPWLHQVLYKLIPLTLNLKYPIIQTRNYLLHQNPIISNITYLYPLSYYLNPNLPSASYILFSQPKPILNIRYPIIRQEKIHNIPACNNLNLQIPEKLRECQAQIMH